MFRASITVAAFRHKPARPCRSRAGHLRCASRKPFRRRVCRLEFVQHGFGAVDEGFVIDDRGIGGRDEFEEVGPVSASRRSEKKSLAERAAWSRVMTASRRRGPGMTGMKIAVVRIVADAGNSTHGAGNLLTAAPSGPFASARNIN